MPEEKDPCIIEPRMGGREKPLPSLAVLFFNADDFKSCHAFLAPPVERGRKLFLSDVFTGYHRGMRIAVAGPMLGAPQTILVLERMIALGVRKFVAVGWCGSLQPSVRIADIVIPSAAISEEGTSRHYSSLLLPPAPSPELAERLKSALAANGLKIHEGVVWTTDAPFRETCSKVARYRSEGVLSVEMETSALFTVASHRKVQLAVALVTSDDLSSLKWVHGFREPVFCEARRLAAQSALTALSEDAEDSSLP
ncbi:MAG: nucleoside phosphorylase [Desulfobacteraceae bacterium]|nr:nucleoside phosphorylase [Desulfobacteraceae bacterium]